MLREYGQGYMKYFSNHGNKYIPGAIYVHYHSPQNKDEHIDEPQTVKRPLRKS